MGRLAREFKADHSYHITTRCNNREFNLARREIRETFLHIIKKAQDKYHFKLYGLCIMLNHVHYLIEPEKPDDLPKIMHWINWYSAMTFNALLNRKGHFWEQRYSCHGFPNHDRQRALNTLRYIHANPKAAGMKTSFFYDFSNYGSYHQLSHDGLSQWHPAFLALAPNLDDCAQKYKGFCTRYTPKKKKTKINQWGKKSLAGLLGNRVTAKQKPVTTGQMSLPFYQPELVRVSLNPIAEQALSFIQANRFNYQFLA